MRRRTFLGRLGSYAAAAACAGCGSIVYPERVGQPRQGPLDWTVVAMDGVGLLLFVVPGLVAFAVDFYNGAIFLPTAGVPYAEAELQTIEVPPEQLSQAHVEQLVSRHVGQPVRLTSATTRVAKLGELAEFGPACERLEAA